MKYTVYESFCHWNDIIAKNVSKKVAEKLVSECPIGRRRWIDPS